MRHSITRFVFIAGIGIIAAGVTVLRLSADTAVRCTPTSATRMVCEIDEPDVTHRRTDYRQISFQPGDRVTVDAGGCAQTGGYGATWKRYVNPSGPNSNRLYSGMINIPGATQGEVKIADVLHQTLVVQPGLRPPDMFLRLGYLDDDDGYNDNGYYSHDDGTENQCRNVGNAFVRLTIDHQPGTPNTCAGSTGNKPLDLVWTECDQNGFPFNPRWRAEVQHPGQVPAAAPALCGNPKDSQYDACTTWHLTYDDRPMCDNPPYSWDFSLHPHVNWFPVTFQGLVDWDKKSTEGTDDDYNYFLFPPHNEGVLLEPDGSNKGMEIEFDSDETIDHFADPLWAAFHQLVANNNSQAQAEVHQKNVVVTGLFGLDCGHSSCAPEVHPAYAMAVDMDNSDLNNDSWLVFGRNWGDEGYCSVLPHPLPLTDVKLLIPWQSGATDVTVLPETQFYTFVNSDSNAGADWHITVAKGQGVQIEFTLPDPAAQVGVNGEVHLRWTMPAGARETVFRNVTSRAGSVARQLRGNSAADRSEGDTPERRIGELISKMSAAQLQIFRTRMQARSFRLQTAGRARASSNGTKLPMHPVLQVSKLPPPAQARLIATPRVEADPRLIERGDAIRTALCDAYKNNVPGAPQFCAAAPRSR